MSNGISVSNPEIIANAKSVLQGRWGKAASLMLVVVLFVVVIPAALEIFFPLHKGAVRGLRVLLKFFCDAFIILWAVKLVRYNEWAGDFSGETVRKFGSIMGGTLLCGLFILLWTLLLIIPGIIAAFNYAVTLFILADNPAMPVLEAIKYSKKMMYGNRWKLFCLNFRFIGWWLLLLLAILAGVIIGNICISVLMSAFIGLAIFCIGCLFVFPYVLAANAEFYNQIRNKYEAENGELPISDYTGMSVLNTILLSVLVFIFNAGAGYLASWGKCIGQ